MDQEFLQLFFPNIIYKFSNFKHIIIVTIILLQINIDYSYVVLPFSYKNIKKGGETILTDTTQNFYDSIFYNHVYSKLKINNKDIDFHISTERHATYLSDNLISDPKQNNKQYSLEYIGINTGKLLHNTSFSLSSNGTNNNYELSLFAIDKIIDNPDFTRFTEGLTDTTEEIGFNILKGNMKSVVQVEEDDPYEYEDDYDDDYIYKNGGYDVEENTNLIYQLKNQTIIDSYAFMIKYEKDKENGEIIIGGLPHEYDPKHYSEKYYIYDTVPIQMYGPFSWHTVFDFISYGNIPSSSIKSVRFAIDYGFIIASNSYRDFLFTNFFGNDDNKNYCKEEKINSYSVFSCQESVVKKFKGMSFHLSTKFYNDKNNILEFNYKDLFVKSSNSNIYYFLIIFKGSNEWVFGKPLFKKYPTVFDQDRKIIGFYTETGEYDVKDKNSGEINYSIIIIIILCIVVLVLGILLYTKGWKMISRKKKANELVDDNFEYDAPLDSESDNQNK